MKTYYFVITGHRLGDSDYRESWTIPYDGPNSPDHRRDMQLHIARNGFDLPSGVYIAPGAIYSVHGEWR